MYVPANRFRTYLAQSLIAMLVLMSGPGSALARAGQDEGSEIPPFSLYTTVFPTSEMRPLDPLTGETFEDMSGNGFGLLRIDTTNGEITGEALDEENLISVLPSPDGQLIYLLDPRTDWWDNLSSSNQVHILRRLDAATLDLAAERELPQYQMVTILMNEPDAGE